MLHAATVWIPSNCHEHYFHWKYYFILRLLNSTVVIISNWRANVPIKNWNVVSKSKPNLDSVLLCNEIGETIKEIPQTKPKPKPNPNKTEPHSRSCLNDENINKQLSKIRINQRKPMILDSFPWFNGFPCSRQFRAETTIIARILQRQAYHECL